MKDFTEGEMDEEDEDKKELSEHDDAVGERGGDEGATTMVQCATAVPRGAGHLGCVMVLMDLATTAMRTPCSLWPIHH